jgi:hypothetical protein
MAWASQLLIRRALARALDDFESYPVTSATTSTVVLGMLANPTASASTNRYDGAWAYIATGTAKGEQRRVRVGGYAPSTGTLTVWPLFSPTPAQYDEAEITRLFPAIENAGGTSDVSNATDTSYRALINRGLGRLAVRDRLPIATTAGTYAYSLVTTSWLDRDARLLGALEPDASGALTVPADWRGVRLRLDAETPYLEVRVPFTGTLTLDVIRPAVSWIKVGAVWGESAVGVGLVADTDEAPVSLDDAVAAGLMEAYEVLMNRSPGRPGGSWAEKWTAQREIVRALRTYDRTSEAAAQPAAPAAGAA